MGNAAGELAEGFHALRLCEHRLGGLTAAHLVRELDRRKVGPSRADEGKAG